jgi:hypothetical protein
VPNAYIDRALENETIAGLIGKHVYFKVDAKEYILREATPAEVAAHYADVRPTQVKFPFATCP